MQSLWMKSYVTHYSFNYFFCKFIVRFMGSTCKCYKSNDEFTYTEMNKII